MPEHDDCPVCFSNSPISVLPGGADINVIDCSRCGEYKAYYEAVLSLKRTVDSSDSGDPMLGQPGLRRRATASAWIRSELSRDSVLSREDVSRLATLREPTVLERAERLLLELEKASEKVGTAIDVDKPEWIAHAWAIDNDELGGILDLLNERELISSVRPRMSGGMTGGPRRAQIKAKGWDYLDSLRKGGVGSTQGFVAMWYDDSLDADFDEGFYPAIEEAGYRPFRLDKAHYTGKIDAEMVSQIHRSKFVVADLTGKNANVHWEAGYAEALGRRVFLTCRSDQWDDRAFDIEHDVCIKWETSEELRGKLRDKIVAVLGQGPHEPVEDGN